MARDFTPGDARDSVRSSGYTSVREATKPTVTPPVKPPVPADEQDVEPRIAITLGVADGFRFGCGLLLAGIAFYFVLMAMVGVAALVALVLGYALPFGLGAH